MSFKQVIYFGADGISGYANAAKGYMYDLLQQGNEVYFERISGKALKGKTEFDVYFSRHLKKLPFFGRSEKLKNAEIVIHITPDIWPQIFERYADLFNDCKIVGRTVWDFDLLPKSWVKNINESIVNVVSVPSQWNKDVFIKSGVKKEIVVEPHILTNIPYKKINLIDILGTAKIFSPNVVDYKNFEKRIKFLNVSENIWRKNIMSLVNDYLNTFEFSDETLLILKVADVERRDIKIETTIKNTIIQKINVTFKGFLYPPIALITNTLDFDQIQNLHDCGDIYVNVSHGEGFNIPCYTAKTKDKCIVTPLHGGMIDYLSEYKNLYKINFTTDDINSTDVFFKNIKRININSKDICDSLKTSYYNTIQIKICLSKLDKHLYYTDLIEKSSLFPIYFKTGWHKENLEQGIWNTGESELIVGNEVSKLELVLDIVKSTPLKLTINDVIYDFELNRGNYSLKIIGQQQKTIKFESNTISGDYIAHCADSQFGIKISNIYVNSVNHKISQLSLNEENLSEEILNVVVNKEESDDIPLKFKNKLHFFKNDVN